MGAVLPNWLTRAAKWLSSLFRTRSDLNKIQARVDRMERQQRIHSGPAEPEGLGLTHGIYWGLFGKGKTKQPFCPACGAKGIWVPLSREEEPVRGSEFVGFRCPRCHHFTDISLRQEAEALRE